MHDLTAAQQRFLGRVDTITVTPWTGKVVAVDKAGKPMRLGKAAFQTLKDGAYIVRSAGTLTTNTYVVQEAVVKAETEARLP